MISGAIFLKFQKPKFTCTRQVIYYLAHFIHQYHADSKLLGFGWLDLILLTRHAIRHCLEAHVATVFPKKVLLYSIDCACTDGPAALIFRMKFASMEHWSPERCPLWRVRLHSPKSEARNPHYLEDQAAAVFLEKMLLCGMGCARTDSPSCSILQTKLASIKHIWARQVSILRSSVSNGLRK